MKKNLKFCLAGGLAGIVNGLLGAGGGLILVPFFRRFTDLGEKEALANSVAVILPLSLVSALM